MSNRHILVIEDDRGIQAITKYSLELEENWQVTSAFSGEAGLTSARTLQPDVILLDILMPDINGLDILARLQNDDTTKAIPVIFFTAKLIDDELLKLQNSNKVKGIITKPFDCLTLARQISDLLGWQYGMVIYFTHKTLASLTNSM